MEKLSYNLLIIAILSLYSCNNRQGSILESYDIVWESQSQNSRGSMPVGGGDIGCNTWVENGDLLLYIGKGDSFDENNTLLKLGRIRINMTPNLLDTSFRFNQRLKLKEGLIEIVSTQGKEEVKINIWVAIDNPVVHIEIESSSSPISINVSYESWRTKDRSISQLERAQCLSYFRTSPENIPLTTYSDSIFPKKEHLIWYHRNRNNKLVVDNELLQQHLDTLDGFWNPLKDRITGGLLSGTDIKFSKTYTGFYMDTEYTGWKYQTTKAVRKSHIQVALQTSQTKSTEQWERLLKKTLALDIEKSRQNHKEWWQKFWDKSHIYINKSKSEKDTAWIVGRNYQLFRYMLGCNSKSSYPTKFNGSLFTVDGPEGTTPDFRLWGGGSFTAQNQRLVYWPMLKNGDFDLMVAQFDFYNRLVKNAELRTQAYWGIPGISFPEHVENFGLPIGHIYEYAWGNDSIKARTLSKNGRNLINLKGDTISVYDPGYIDNQWVEDQYETILEFCLMILDYHSYSGEPIDQYYPLIFKSVQFFDRFYRRWNRILNGSELLSDSTLHLYPSTAGETYKKARNSTPLVAGLKSVIGKMLEMPDSLFIPHTDKEYLAKIFKSIPPIPIGQDDGKEVILPAESWERRSNNEIPQLYPVFPYRFYGIENSNDIAINTWRAIPDDDPQKNAYCWFQGGIFCARMGLIEESKEYLIQKFLWNSERFPAFWEEPGFDQMPDFDHGGSGMVNLQEMLLQTNGKEIRLLPSWPDTWDVDFKVHAPYRTVISGVFKNGKLQKLEVEPAYRKRDIIIHK